MLIWEMIAHQRRQLAHLLDDFDEAQWRTPSLCADWTVREVVGHLITPFAWGTAKFLRRFVVGGCNFHKTMSQAAKQLAQRPTSTLVGTLRAHAETRFAPPGLGPEASLIDIVMHTQDICRPLGIPQSVDGDRARRILDFLVSRKARVIKAWVLTDPSMGRRPASGARRSRLGLGRGGGSQGNGRGGDDGAGGADRSTR